MLIVWRTEMRSVCCQKAFDAGYRKALVEVAIGANSRADRAASLHRKLGGPDAPYKRNWPEHGPGSP